MGRAIRRLVGERDGRAVTAAESFAATRQELDVTVAGNHVTIAMTVTDPRLRGTGATDGYEVDGQYHEYEWGDTVPRSIGSRAAVGSRGAGRHVKPATGVTSSRASLFRIEDADV
jgi:hypothetical protein